MFAKLKEKLTGSVSKLSGNTDFLEAVCASSALVAFADGDCSDAELDTALRTVKSNPSLSSAFKAGEIEKTMNKMLDRAQAGRTGRVGLMKEIEEVSAEMGETVYLCALDVAESDGNIDEKEQKILDKIASVLGVNTASYDI